MVDSDGATTGIDLGECPRNVHEGSLLIKDDAEFDVAALRSLTEVTGHLLIQDVDVGTDLSFLSCLQVVDELSLSRAPNLQTLQGLEQLRSVGELIVGGHPELTSLNGLSGIREVESLRVSNNPQMLNWGFSTLEQAGRIEIGNCSGFEPRGGPGLTDITGLDGLRFVNFLAIEGNENLVSLDGLAALQAEGLVIEGIAIMHNRALPTEHAQAIAGLFDDKYPHICGNNGDDTDWDAIVEPDAYFHPCFCDPPE
jgi:hypothetical protein